MPDSELYNSHNFKNLQYYKFCFYGFLKNLRFFDAFFLLIFIDDGLSYFRIGILYSVREIVTQIFEIPSGMIADSWGRRKTMLIALSSYIISFVFFYYSDSYLFYLIAMIFFGFAEAFRSGTHKAMIVDYLNQNNLSQIKSQYYGSTRSWSQMGSSIASLAGAAIVFVTGHYKIIFLLTIIPYLINLYLIWSYPKSLDKIQKSRLKESFYFTFKNTFKATFKAITKPEIIRILFSSSTIISLFKGTKDYIQPLIRNFALGFAAIFTYEKLTDQQFESIFIGLFYSIIFILTSISSRYAYKFEQKFTTTAVSANVVYLLTGIVIFLSGLFNSLGLESLAILFFLGLYISQNLRRPIMMSYISEKIPGEILASGLSVESQLKTLLIALFSPILGFIIDTFSLSAGIMCCGLIILITYPLTKLNR